MIFKNEIPILEYDDSSGEVIAPNHESKDLKLPEKCFLAFLGDVVHTDLSGAIPPRRFF